MTAKNKAVRTDPWAWVNAKKVVYLVLYKDGTPHPGIEPQTSYADAQAAMKAGSYMCINGTCQPHRVQAYRPMI